ncbi:MAG: hypothetical protein WBZ31_03040 [Thiobacillus sp.]
MSKPTKSRIKDKPLRLHVPPFARVLFSFVVIGFFSHTQAYADEPFYRCVVKGKTIYTDKPCVAPTLPGVVGSTASTSSKASDQAGKPTQSIELDYTTPYGIWRGQAQYQVAVKGQPVREAHAVVPLVIEVEKQGRVQGISPANGCKMLGVAAPYVAPNMLTLDVTLSECRYTGLNQRYTGRLALTQASNSAQLSLQSMNSMVTVLMQGPANNDIKATMKR